MLLAVMKQQEQYKSAGGRGASLASKVGATCCSSCTPCGAEEAAAAAAAAAAAVAAAMAANAGGTDKGWGCGRGGEERDFSFDAWTALGMWAFNGRGRDTRDTGEAPV